jgi:hypothetical protein
MPAISARVFEENLYVDINNVVVPGLLVVAFLIFGTGVILDYRKRSMPAAIPHVEQPAGNAEPDKTLEMALHQRDLLAKSLGELLVAMGVTRADAPLTGLELLCAADAAILNLRSESDAHTE